MTYQERGSVLPGVQLWRQGGHPVASTARILPDGCMDLIWDGARLFVAGPDSRARWHPSAAGTEYVGLRFARGFGPSLLGVPADELRDRSPELPDVWPGADARALADRVAEAPAGALERWLLGQLTAWEEPALGSAVFALAARGVPVAAMAERLGYNVRQLHRRCLPLFGYGPQHLARVLRLGQVVIASRTGQSLARVAAAAGYTDQAHLTRDVRELAGTTPGRLVRELPG